MNKKLRSRCLFLGFALVFAGVSLAEDGKPKVSIGVNNTTTGQPAAKFETGVKIPTSSTPTAPTAIDTAAVSGAIIVNRSGGLYKKPLKFKKLRIVREQTSFTTNTNEQGEFRFQERFVDGDWTISIEGCPETKSVTIKGTETEIPEWTILCQK